jgi:hypothetical protein
MGLNKAALCGRLQQTGLGRAGAQGHPGRPGGRRRLGRLALEGVGCMREKEAYRAGLAATQPTLPARGAALRAQDNLAPLKCAAELNKKY